MSQFYFKFSTLIILLSLSLSFIGCAATGPSTRYSHQSPTVSIMKESGNKRMDRTGQDGLRYDPEATLSGSLKTAGEVEIMVTFTYYPPRRSRGP